jgi:predicted ATPase
VLEIRKALGDPVDEPRFIHTLHRRGYRFLSTAIEPQAPVEQVREHPGVVGRAREFLELDAWFEEAAESSRQIVFITGEAGLGKTTLVDNWLSSVRQRRPAGVAVARGRCLQQFGSGEPYLPVFEALDQLSKALGRRLVDVLRERAPTWLLHMPALISLEDRAKLRDEVFGSTRERMLREITDALEALSAETPLVIALEDLHWSDPSTLDLLSSVARRTMPARLMILATYRPADAGGGAAPLLVAQNELELHRQCRVLPLAYLSESETGEYLGTRFPGMDSTPALATTLHHRTNGNPLYVVCLIDELERSGRIDDDPETIRDIVPDTLQQMFERQASQLSDPEQQMLDAAAIAGESFSIAGVAATLGWDPAQVESLCEALVRRQVILKRGDLVRFPDGTESAGYSFLHALCRDALYRRIPSGRRARLHGLLGNAEEQLYASDPKRISAELAGRFEIAGDFSRGIQYLRMAADGAAARYSNKEAARYLERAFGMIERLRDADQASRRMELLEQRALMRLSASDMSGAASDFRDLGEQARLRVAWIVTPEHYSRAPSLCCLSIIGRRWRQSMRHRPLNPALRIQFLAPLLICTAPFSGCIYLVGATSCHISCDGRRQS